MLMQIMLQVMMHVIMLVETMMQTTSDGGVCGNWFLKHIKKYLGCCSFIALKKYLEH
jgi:hypothetical protein